MRLNYYDSGKYQQFQEAYVKSGKRQQVHAKHLEKKREQDHEGLKESQRKWFQTWRSSHNENARYRNFLEDSKFGPIFICICCNRKLSRGNVTVYSESVESQIKIPLEDCIFDMDVYTNVIECKNGKEISPNNRYIISEIISFSIINISYIAGTSVLHVLDI